MRQATLLATFLLAGTSCAFADDYPFVGEALPPHLENRIALQDPTLELASANVPDSFFISTVKLWPTNSPIKVCFFDGSAALRAAIAKAAATWTKQGANVPLDFGNAADPRLCSTAERSQIRIGFAYAGYWSLVGTDSITAAPQGEQSMNFIMFDVNPPPEPQFTQIVLHEFGHALGFQHEHQSWRAQCETEIDWPKAYDFYAKSPNFWSKSKTDHNLRPRHEPDDEASLIDRGSIMLYPLPPQILIAGTSSKCYTPGNVVLSNGDIAGLRKYYPNTASEVAAIRAETLSQVQAAVDRLPVTELERNFAKLQASTLLQPDSLELFSQALGGTGFRDLGILQNMTVVPIGPNS